MTARAARRLADRLEELAENRLETYAPGVSSEVQRQDEERFNATWARLWTNLSELVSGFKE